MKSKFNLNFNYLLFFVILILTIFIYGCSNNETYKEPFPSKSLLSSSNNTILLLFHGSTCPHCHEAIKFLNGIKKDYPNLEIRSAEVWSIKSNANLFQQLAENYGKKATGVPGIFIGEHMFVGYSDNIGQKIIDAIDECKTIKCDNPLLKLK